MGNIAAARIGDMHPTRLLEVVIQTGGDIVLKITQDGSLIEENGSLSEEARKSVIEFCANSGRSQHTRVALVALIAAMEKDNSERPV